MLVNLLDLERLGRDFRVAIDRILWATRSTCEFPLVVLVVMASTAQPAQNFFQMRCGSGWGGWMRRGVVVTSRYDETNDILVLRRNAAGRKKF